jgi:2-dehydropantoate 2-reductase
MNGVDPGERTRHYLGKGIVVDSLIYIVAFANDDYSITQQGKYANLRIGLMDAKTEKEKEAVALVSAILKEADVDHLVSDDIERDIWRKYILNCAYNVETAYYDNNIGQLRADPIKAKEHELLVQEAYQVALKKGVHVQQSDVDAIIHRFYKELQDGATSSLQRDIRAGKQAEVDTFSGYIVREAKKLQVEAPVSEKMYEGLKEKTKQ